MTTYKELVFEKAKKVLIIDDVPDDVRALRDALESKEISYEYRKVDLAGEPQKFYPIESVDLIFLDLNYNHGVMGPVNADFCAEQIKNSVVEGQIYYLVGWTKDPEEFQDVIDLLAEYNLPPVMFTAMKKDWFRSPAYANNYNIDGLFQTIDQQFNDKENIQEFAGQIISNEEDSVLINCLMNEDPNIFEVRRFDLLPFQNHIALVKGGFVKIKITTKPGSRVFEFFADPEDRSALFIKSDDFLEFDDLSFLQG